MLIPVFYVAFYVAALLLWKILLDWFSTTEGNLPPSPRGRLPVIGHLWLLDPVKPFLTIDNWSKQLGDVFCVFFGSQRVILISRERLMREAYLRQGNNFCGRPRLFVHESCWGRGHIISDGPEHTEMRKFLLSCLRQKNGDAHGAIQSALRREIERMVVAIDTRLHQGDDLIDIQETVFYVVGNVLTSFLLGKTYPHGSVEFWESSRWLEKTLELMDRSAPLTFLPWLRYAPPDGFGYWKMKAQASAVHQTMCDEIQKRIASQDYKDTSKEDLTSIFLRKIDELGAKEEVSEAERICFTNDKLAMLMVEMYFAGIQTECNTFGWAFLYFVEFPDVQEKCRTKIFEKFGADGEIEWADRRVLPYVEATVMEVQRCANIAPFSLFRRNLYKTTLDGYCIPEDSMIMMNLYSTMTDPKCFPEPEKFNPERYLDSCGEMSVSNVKGLYPYGLGRRMCMGENIARCELFLVICALLRRYRFRKIPGRTYSLEQKMQLTIHPDRFQLLVEHLCDK